MQITLYTTYCPKCNVLKQKLDDKQISYSIVDDMNIMVDMGFKSAPILEVDGQFYDFTHAIQWINGR